MLLGWCDLSYFLFIFLWKQPPFVFFHPFSWLLFCFKCWWFPPPSDIQCHNLWLVLTLFKLTIILLPPSVKLCIHFYGLETDTLFLKTCSPSFFIHSLDYFSSRRNSYFLNNCVEFIPLKDFCKNSIIFLCFKIING